MRLIAAGQEGLSQEEGHGYATFHVYHTRTIGFTLLNGERAFLGYSMGEDRIIVTRENNRGARSLLIEVGDNHISCFFIVGRPNLTT